MRIKYKLIYSMVVLFTIITSTVLSGQETIIIKKRILITPQVSGEKTVLKESILRYDKKSFSYSNIKSNAREISYAISAFDFITKHMTKCLKNNQETIRMKYGASAWAALYANMEKLSYGNKKIDKNSATYMLSLLYTRRYEQAQKIGIEILKDNPNQYDVMVLLGLLSIRNKDNFKYFENAFVINPSKTLSLFSFHLNQFAISPKKGEEQWDFVEAFFQMLIKHEKLWMERDVQYTVTKTVQDIFIAKYGNYLDKEERKKIKPKLLSFANSIRY